MRYTAALVAAIPLAACAQDQNWQRFDGLLVNSSPALQQQYSVDLATCRAIAVNAGNQVPIPPSAPYSAPQVDFSGFDEAGRNIAAAGQRQRTEEANMHACMAQKGYNLAR
jgi:hypothetical protein